MIQYNSQVSQFRPSLLCLFGLLVTVEDFVSMAAARLEPASGALWASVARLAPAGRSLPPVIHSLLRQRF